MADARLDLLRADGREVELLHVTVCEQQWRFGHQRCTALARHRPACGRHPPVTVVDTDFGVARQVGAVLHGATSADLVDAHVVAVCACRGDGVVSTSDPDDIARLAVAVPAVRVITRPAC